MSFRKMLELVVVLMSNKEIETLKKLKAKI